MWEGKIAGRAKDDKKRELDWDVLRV